MLRSKNQHVCLDLQLRRQTQQCTTHCSLPSYWMHFITWSISSSAEPGCALLFIHSCLWLSALTVTMIMATSRHESQEKKTGQYRRESRGRAWVEWEQTSARRGLTPSQPFLLQPYFSSGLLFFLSWECSSP